MPRRVFPLLAIAAVAICAVAAGGASAKHRDTRTFCAKTGDFCVAIHHATTSPRFELTSLAFGGTYQLCVNAPDGVRTCHDFVLRKQRFGQHHSNVSWKANFPVAAGRHSVAWLKDGTQIAPTLHFSPLQAPKS